MITGSVVGSDQVIQRLNSMPAALRSALTFELTKIAIKLQRHVMADKLTGQVLHVRTDNLRPSVNWKVRQEGDAVYGTVGTPVFYGMLHEFGMVVKAHERVITKVFGKPLKDGPKAIQVQAYELPERSFLRSALGDMQAEIRQRMEAVVRKTLAGAPK